jgi:hypothetical protein
MATIRTARLNIQKLSTQCTVFTRVICALFFYSFAAEKSECVKYTDFPAFGPRNALLSLFAFLIILFLTSNNARNLSLFVRRCITIILLSHLEILTKVHTRIVKKQLKYLRYITVQSCSQLPQGQQPLIFKDKQQC